MAPLVIGLHALFWAPFLVRGQLDKRAGPAASGPAAHQNAGATALVWLHALALGVTYVGLGLGLLGEEWFAFPMPVRLIGVPVIVATAYMIVRVMMVFRSWRLRAVLTADHRLCTDGPFRVIRHPIYAGLVLLTIASFLLVPNWITAAGILTNFVAGDVRSRAEERLLDHAFGDRYRAYMARTRRLLPGVY